MAKLRRNSTLSCAIGWTGTCQGTNCLYNRPKPLRWRISGPAPSVQTGRSTIARTANNSPCNSLLRFPTNLDGRTLFGVAPAARPGNCETRCKALRFCCRSIQIHECAARVGRGLSKQDSTGGFWAAKNCHSTRSHYQAEIKSADRHCSSYYGSLFDQHIIAQFPS